MDFGGGDGFVLNDPSFKGKFVFAEAEASWMHEKKVQSSGAKKLFKLRLWHMDASLITNFHQALPNIYHDCNEFGIDIEHSYWKNLHGYPICELGKIGVEGTLGTNGTFMED